MPRLRCAGPPPWRRVACLLVALCATAGSVPCSALAGLHAPAHDGPAMPDHAHAGGAESPAGAAMEAICPCGCDEASSAGSPAARPGWALAPAAPVLGPAIVARALPRATPRLAMEIPRPVDHVPLSS